MPFFHVDDGFHGHKKLARLGIEDFHAIALWTVAGSWSSDNLEDGFVPDYIAARMHPDYKEFANALVRVGLWEVAEKGGEAGWQFHDWTGPGRNPSAEQVHKERAANAERQREFRSRVKGTKPKGEEPPEPPEPQGWAPPDPPMNDGGSNGVTEPLVTDGVRDPVPFRSVPFRSNEENPFSSPTASPPDDANLAAVIPLFPMDEPAEPAAEQPTEKKAKPKAGRKKISDAPRPDVDALCNRLVELMIANECKPPTITQAWRDETRRMLDIDGRDFNKAMGLLEWSQKHWFWKPNIHSMKKFREKYDQMRQQANAEWERGTIPGQRANSDLGGAAHMERFRTRQAELADAGTTDPTQQPALEVFPWDRTS
jgi:hypothetical protein